MQFICVFVHTMTNELDFTCTCGEGLEGYFEAN